MNKEITTQDLVDLFVEICPEINISEEEIEKIRKNMFEDGTSFDTVRGFMLHKVFVAAITELYDKMIMI